MSYPISRRGVGVMTALGLVLLAAPGTAQDRGTPEDAQALVARAIEHYDAVGAEAAFAAFGDPSGGFVDRDLYIFVVGPERALVAHGFDAELVGRPTDTLVDVDGVSFGTMFVEEATAEGTWVDYRWTDPATGEIHPKSSWVVLHDDHVFGAGIYKPEGG